MPFEVELPEMLARPSSVVGVAGTQQSQAVLGHEGVEVFGYVLLVSDDGLT
ncbi:hypothetical protein ACFWBN_09385 [Streptomyces sp. NPDC059989]|uniref:hypothetical protein n=1 Tax=Streptomyces sp. NPDC059989 TaxID=3347026 RepID=UPI00368A05FE